MAETHHREFSELPITVDRGLETPLPAQIAAALREAIDQRTLRPGEAVPASRELARRLGVARGVVVSAYEQLIAEGYLSASHGRGTRDFVVLTVGEGVGSGAVVDDTLLGGHLGFAALLGRAWLSDGRNAGEVLSTAPLLARAGAAAGRTLDAADLLATDLGPKCSCGGAAPDRATRRPFGCRSTPTPSALYSLCAEKT